MYSTLKSETFSPVQVKEIQVKTNLSKIQFIACPENEIKITWHDTSKRTTKANLTGDTLHIEDKAPITFYSTKGFIDLKRDNDISIEIPNTFCGDIHIEATDEIVRILGLQSCNRLSAQTRIANIECSSISANSISLTTIGGKIDLRGVSATSRISLKTERGEINCICIDSAEDYLYDIHTNNRICEIIPPAGGNGPKIFQAHSRHGAFHIQFNNEKGSKLPF